MSVLLWAYIFVGCVVVTKDVDAALSYFYSFHHTYLFAVKSELTIICNCVHFDIFTAWETTSNCFNYYTLGPEFFDEQDKGNYLFTQDSGRKMYVSKNRIPAFVFDYLKPDHPVKVEGVECPWNCFVLSVKSLPGHLNFNPLPLQSSPTGGPSGGNNGGSWVPYISTDRLWEESEGGETPLFQQKRPRSLSEGNIDYPSTEVPVFRTESPVNVSYRIFLDIADSYGTLPRIDKYYFIYDYFSCQHRNNYEQLHAALLFNYHFKDSGVGTIGAIYCAEAQFPIEGDLV